MPIHSEIKPQRQHGSPVSRSFHTKHRSKFVDGGMELSDCAGGQLRRKTGRICAGNPVPGTLVRVAKRARDNQAVVDLFFCGEGYEGGDRLGRQADCICLDFHATTVGFSSSSFSFLSALNG
ncbi:hypothetical protein MAP00_000109 [Monascus purpureus]|nr:hypothetical protein MAP00_000109 [Monascus purpureus]